MGGQARWLRWLGKGSGPKQGGGEGEQ